MDDPIVAFFVGLYVGILITAIVACFAIRAGIKKAFERHDEGR